MNALLRSVTTGVLAIAVAGAGLSNVLVAQAATNTAPVITSFDLTPAVVNEGDTVRVDFTFTDPVATMKLVTVFWGDGQSDPWTMMGQGSSFSTHKYNDDPLTTVDTYQVRLVIDDLVSHVAVSDSRTLTVLNVAPVLTAFTVTPATIVQGQSATVRGSFVDPSLGDSYPLKIDWGDGSDPAETTLGSRSRSFSLTHPYSIGGRTFTITATLNDDDGGVGVATVPIVVTSLNTAPTGLSVVPGAAFEGGTTALAVTFSDPDAADRHSLSVNWGDGTPAESPALPAGARSFSPTHVYQDSGSYDATVAVADGLASTPVVPVVVNVGNVGPTLTALNLSASSILEQESVTADVTFADPGVSDTFKVTVAWGDGSSWSADLGAGARSASASHQYVAAGQFDITATVTDRDNAAGSMTTALEVRALKRAPTGLVLRANSPADGNPVTLTGSFTDLDAADSHTVAVDWGDGSTGRLALGARAASFSTTHTYPTRGTYHVTVTVTDPAGLATNAALDVVVQKKNADKKDCDKLMAFEQRLFHHAWANEPRGIFARLTAMINARFGCDYEEQGAGDAGAQHTNATQPSNTRTNDESPKSKPKGDRSGRSDR